MIWSEKRNRSSTSLCCILRNTSILLSYLGEPESEEFQGLQRFFCYFSYVSDYFFYYLRPDSVTFSTICGYLFYYIGYFFYYCEILFFVQKSELDRKIFLEKTLENRSVILCKVRDRGTDCDRCGRGKIQINRSAHSRQER